jgi:polar amino acid transport system substrate-binding protein
MRRTWTIAVVALCLLYIGCAPAGGSGGPDRVSTLKKILDRGSLIVGLEAEFFPFEYMKDGELHGFDVDLARMMAKELGVKLEVRNVAFGSLQSELLTGKVDVILSGMTATLDRAKRVLFSNSYYQTGLCLLLHSETTKDVKSVADLNDPKYRVIAKLSTTGHFTAKRLLPKAKLLTLPKETICALEVSQGKADAFLYDQLAVVKHQRQYPDTTRTILEPFTYEPYSMGLPRGDFEWWSWVNLFLAQIEKDGRYDELWNRHLAEFLGER